MKKANLLTVLALGLMVVQCGCSAKLGKRTGFLSDYSRLERQSDISYRYIGPSVGSYSRLIVDPVKAHFHTGSKASNLSDEELTDLQNYMHMAVLKALSDGYMVVYQPGPDVARIRIALTDVKKSKAMMNIVPTTKLVGSGLGGASMEIEVLDSQTGVQVGAAIESQLGSRLSLKGITKWGDAKAVMDDWAKRLRARLDEAR
jgi:hypothetical protein